MLDSYIQKHGRRLYGLCRTLCANPLDAEDLYQDTWLKVYKKFDLYNPEFEFERWLTRICVNTFRDHYRKKKTSMIVDNFQSQEIKDTILNNAPAKVDEDYSDLHDAVQRLPEKIRLTVILYYFKELDVSETAQALSIPTGTVKSRLNKARNLLKELMEDEIEL